MKKTISIVMFVLLFALALSSCGSNINKQNEKYAGTYYEVKNPDASSLDLIERLCLYSDGTGYHYYLRNDHSNIDCFEWYSTDNRIVTKNGTSVFVYYYSIENDGTEKITTAVSGYDGVTFYR